MKLLTITAAFLTLLLLTSCEKTIQENTLTDQFESSEIMFFFEQSPKESQIDKGYRMEAELKEVNNSGSFVVSWGASEDSYTLSFVPAENEVRFSKFFDGKECLEVADVNLGSRSNTLDFNVVEDDKGQLKVSLNSKILFENTQKSFIPAVGTYKAEGDLRVGAFKLHQF